MRAGQVVAIVILVGGLAFGLFGGEYRAIDSWKLKRQVREEQLALELLTLEIDSLRAYAESLETNREMQERVARERFGMIRDGEIVYRIEPVER
ncbi:septum formation initiator family protein [Gemmatimonadota bacterium]